MSERATNKNTGEESGLFSKHFVIEGVSNSFSGSLPVSIVSDGGGGSFDGQLTQGGNDLSAANPLPVEPLMTSGGNISVQTAATGTNYTAFASQVCKQLTVSNQSGTTIEVRQGAAGVGLQIPTGTFYTFFGITNTNQLDVRRVDTSNTQITITARWEA